jgi:hypothetical protein
VGRRHGVSTAESDGCEQRWHWPPVASDLDRGRSSCAPRQQAEQGSQQAGQRRAVGWPHEMSDRGHRRPADKRRGWRPGCLLPLPSQINCEAREATAEEPRGWRPFSTGTSPSPRQAHQAGSGSVLRPASGVTCPVRPIERKPGVLVPLSACRGRARAQGSARLSFTGPIDPVEGGNPVWVSSVADDLDGVCGRGSVNGHGAGHGRPSILSAMSTSSSSRTGSS